MSTHIHGPLGAQLVVGFFLELSRVIVFSKICLEHVVMLVGLQGFVALILYHDSLCFSLCKLQLYNGYLQVWFKHKRCMFGVTIIQ